MNRMRSILCCLIAGTLYIGTAEAADRAEVLAKFTPEEIVKFGEDIYQTPGQQTCQKCHMGNGQGEGWAGAADLRKPYKWNSFNGLGGYERLASDPEKMRAEMRTVLEYLIDQGGLKFNLQFKKAHPDVVIDWTKSVTPNKREYDMMMWGIVQTDHKIKIKKIQTDLKGKGVVLTDAEMRDLAICAVIEYVKTFEEPNKLPDGTEAPKILAGL